MLALPAVSTTRTLKVLLLARVWPDKLQLFWPELAVASCQVVPLSSETCTVSSTARLVSTVPEMVWAAVLVVKSVLELPVSAENFTVSTNTVGAVVSMVIDNVLDNLVLTLPARSVALTETRCTPSLRVLAVMLQLPLPSAVVLPSTVVPSVSYSFTLALASAVPLTMGVALLVMSSVLELPVSLPLVRSGAPGVAGAVVSTKRVVLAETVELTLPEASYSLTVRAYVPSARPFSALLHLPVPSTANVASGVGSEPLYSSTYPFASAVPLKLGLSLEVTASLLELPVSSAAFSTGVAGVPVGAVRSIVTSSLELALLTLPARSVALAVMECTPSESTLVA